MKFYIGVTDQNWFQHLSNIQPDEVNFWQPGGKQTFKAIQTNDLFLFKLHSPHNFIVGGGFFVRHSFLPVSLAWEAFGNKNGMADYIGFRNGIHKYRKSDFQSEPDPTIGCIILALPFSLKNVIGFLCRKIGSPILYKVKHMTPLQKSDLLYLKKFKKNLIDCHSEILSP